VKFVEEGKRNKVKGQKKGKKKIELRVNRRVVRDKDA